MLDALPTRDLERLPGNGEASPERLRQLVSELLTLRRFQAEKHSESQAKSDHVASTIRNLENKNRSHWRRVQDLSDEVTRLRAMVGLPTGNDGRTERPEGDCLACGALPVGEIAYAARIQVCDDCAIKAVRLQYSALSDGRMPGARSRKRSPVRGKVLFRDGWQCRYCGASEPEMTMDHVFPRSRGGGASLKNLVVCCRACNTKKADSAPWECGMALLPVPDPAKRLSAPSELLARELVSRER